MKFHRRTIRRPRESSALAVLETCLNTPDEAAWYAERLQRLGKAIFGDLWESDKSAAAREPQKIHEQDTN